MTNLVFLVEQTATGLLILFAVGVAVALWKWSRAQANYRGTYFELERELWNYRRANWGTVAILLVEAALVVIGLQRVVAPSIRENINVPDLAVPVLEDGEFRTPTPAPLDGGIVIDASGVQFGQEDPANQIIATPTLTPTPVGTIIPNVPAPQGCDTENAMLQVPANGMIVFEPITVRGRANVENFAFYRFELRGESTFDNYATIGGDRTLPVPELGELGSFVPSFYEPGEYQFRVSVFDITNTVKASCTITIYISDPIPTPTPLGTETSR
jgi:hypothetical protein